MHHPILPYQTSLPSTLSKPAAGVVVILAVVVLLDIVLLLGRCRRYGTAGNWTISCNRRYGICSFADGDEM